MHPFSQLALRQGWLSGLDAGCGASRGLSVPDLSWSSSR